MYSLGVCACAFDCLPRLCAFVAQSTLLTDAEIEVVLLRACGERKTLPAILLSLFSAGGGWMFVYYCSHTLCYLNALAFACWQKKTSRAALRRMHLAELYAAVAHRRRVVGFDYRQMGDVNGRSIKQIKKIKITTECQ